ncbi:YeiH family protein [Acuticoccus sp.]|uniref:YeiH family protein n=1 Tax=Acuticoccus sp. TaxID=1904378 RepID=UPI003B517BEF
MAEAPNASGGALRLTRGAQAVLPGLGIALTVALASRFISEHYGAPVMLMALLIGMAFSFLSEPGSRCAAGIAFASRTVLRLGVALLGLGITVQQVVSLGLPVVAIVLIGVATTIGAAILLSRALGRGTRFGVLTGGATAICGASAALAISAALPQDKDKERDTIFAVIGVTTLSTVAMIVYPILAGFIGLSDRAAGVFMGATIHDVAQVVGAGYSVSQEAGDTATIVKLFRVALLAPVVIGVSLAFATRGRSAGGGPPIPLFVVGFVALVVVGSANLVPAAVAEPVLELSRWCLITAIAALGMKTSLKTLAEVGGRAVGLLVAITVILAALGLVMIVALGV